MNPARLREARWQLRSVAAGMALFGGFFMYEGIREHTNIANNPPSIDESSPFNYAVTSYPMNFVYVIEGVGMTCLTAAGIAAYMARGITKQLREE